jgi:hypothetical protein
MDEAVESVIKSCKWVEALTRNDGYKGEIHKVKLIWGDLFQDSTWIVSSAPYKLSQFHASKGMKPRQAYQEITLKRVIDHNRTRAEILNIHS